MEKGEVHPADGVLKPGRPPIATRRGWQASLSSLSNRNFRWFWLAVLASFTAMQMEMVIRGWLVYDLTGSALALGEVTAAAGVPILVLSLFGGVVADRVEKRNLLLVTQGAVGVITIAVAALIGSGRIEFWHLVVAALLAGAVFSFDMPARQAIVPELVSRAELMNAIALNSSAMNLTRILAPALAGILVGIIAVAGVYYLIALCYVIVVGLLLMIPPTGSALATGQGAWASLVEGLSSIRRNPTILSLLVLAFALVVLIMPYMILLPVFAVDVYHVGAEGLGIMMGISGVGALVGSLGVAALGNYERKGLLLLASGVVFGGSLALFGISSNFILSLAFLLIAGMGGAIYMAVNNTLIMTHVPDEIRGRVMSVYMMTFGMAPIAALPAGVLAEAIGAPWTVALGGAMVVVITLVVALLRPSLLRLP